ncbi:MAG TPA: phosphatidate cytidylyltransferase [Chloroflexota bacterium]|jgi:phosphatidate cytidylyltransferase
MWLSNPAASPAFGPLAASVGGLLLASLGGLVALERGRLRQSVLLRRWAVWALIAPTYALGALGGPLAALLLVSALSVQALREYAALVGLPRPYRRALVASAPLAAGAALLGPAAQAALPPLLLIAATLLPLLGGDVQAGGRHLARAAFGWAYLAWLPSYLLLIQRDLPHGPELLLALGLAVALADVGAYVVGKTAGRRQLAPAINPRKTWGGAAGALLGAALGLALAAASGVLGADVGATSSAWGGALGAATTALTWMGLAVVVAVGAVWGDLFESLLKREASVKDAGGWLPGFGGLLDRVDSLVVVLPLSYCYLLAVLG